MNVKQALSSDVPRKIFLALIFSMLMLAFLVGQAQAASVTLDVTPSGGAYNLIQDAINAAPITTDTVKIRVAEGIYHQNIGISNAKNLTIEGGWNSSFTNRDTNRTTVAHGDASGTEINISSSTVTIDGLTVTRGSNSDGGGIDVWASNLTLRNSKVVRNWADDEGGGIRSSNTNLTIENSEVSHNITSGDDGNYHGGGLYVNGGTLTIRNSTISDNNATADTYGSGDGYGGGLYLTNTVAAIEKSRILNNTTIDDGDGGGIWANNTDLALINTLVAGNSAWDDEGGGLYYYQNNNGKILTIVNSTFVNNFADFGGGGADISSYLSGTVDIRNSVFWGNLEPNDIYLNYDSGTTTLTISYSDIGTTAGDAFVPGPGVIGSDPLYVNPSAGNYHLRKYSPAIDTATSAGAPADDLDGISRPKGAGFDMGVFEEPLNFDTVAPKSRVNTPAYSINQSRTNRFKVKWSASDAYPSSGSLMYQVWVKRGYRGKWRLWRKWTPRTSGTYKGRRRKTYYFKVKAKDAAGNSGAFTKAKSTVVPADGLFGQFIKKQEGFMSLVGASTFKRNYFGSVMRSVNFGDAVAYRLKTKQFTVFATKGRRNGKAKVYINGRFSRLINTNSRTSKYRQMVYKKDFRRTKYYTIEIVNVGRRRKARLDIDALGAKL